MKVKLEDVCERGSSNLKLSDVENSSGEFPIYGASGYIGNVDFYHQDKKYVAVIKDGAGVGRTTLHPAKSSVIGTMQYLIPKDNIIPEYLYYVVRNMHLEKYYTGATIPHIYFKDYKNEKFNLNSIDKQREIVNILNKCEKIIIKRQNQLKSLDELVRARFIEMFENKEYEKVQLSNICDFITKGTTPQSNQIYDIYKEGLIPYLKVYNLSFTGELLFKEKPQYISKEVHDGKLSRSKVYPNDVLMNIVGPPLGKFSIVTDEFKEWNINQAIAIFRAKEKIIPIFLMYSLMQPYVLTPFLDMAVGVRQLNLSLEQCREIEIMLPPMELQNQFADFVQQVDKSKVTIKKSLKETQTLFDSLMQKYFG
ncbi:MAG: restriction endonuclease subunit S [Selenomonadaceae bacterium]|nr:restriction endonuclease subunit S [Selenomonadaceae bacterium]